MSKGRTVIVSDLAGDEITVEMGRDGGKGKKKEERKKRAKRCSWGGSRQNK